MIAALVYCRETMIRVRHLSHSFGPHWALKDCTFSLGKGDFLFLSGPSGAGKTTLLRLLYAALPIQRGEADVAGMSLKAITPRDVPTLRRQVGVVFQDFKILPLRSVQENLALPLQVRGLAPQHIERRVRAVSRALGLDARLSIPCGELSGGEQQRVAIARAFVVNPQVLLADEPTGNLDPELSFRLMELFKQFQAYGATVIFATHSTELLRRHPSARVMRLEEGMITQANWPGARIFHSPANTPDPAPGGSPRGGVPAGSGSPAGKGREPAPQPDPRPLTLGGTAPGTPGGSAQSNVGRSGGVRG